MNMHRQDYVIIIILVAITGERAFDKTEVGLNSFMSLNNNENALLMQNTMNHKEHLNGLEEYILHAIYMDLCI